MTPLKRTQLVTALQLALAVGFSHHAMAQPFPAEINLSDLDSSDGFSIDGEADYDASGFSVSGAGDINGDGLDDLIIGSPYADRVNYTVGSAHVVFGSSSGFSSPTDLGSLNGSNGFEMTNQVGSDQVARSVSNAGDVNGDGIDDVIVGAAYSDPNGNGNAGRSYVLFGSDTGFPAEFDLNTLDGSDGFSINGEAGYDESGFSVSTAGDVNGDDIDDLIIGAPDADPNGSYSGRSYIVFGTDSGFSSELELSSLSGSIGFAMNGETAYDGSGYSVSTAGDFNGDGFDDVVIGAPGAMGNASGSGRSYLVFGGAGVHTDSLDLGQLAGFKGFIMDGQGMSDDTGISVSAAGDFNNDGFDDLIIGADGATVNGQGRSGRSYIVFGTDQLISTPLNLGALNGSNGIIIQGDPGEDESASLGRSVHGAGDINGDGIDDVIIGAPEAGVYPDRTGKSYVVFGTDLALPAVLDINTLDGINGLVLNGEDNYDYSGHAVSAAGDINGDGIDDLVVGSYSFEPAGGYSRPGRTYVVFGRPLPDLAVTKNNGFAFVDSGFSTTWQIEVSNLGASAVNGATLSDTIPAEAGNASWTCSGSGGATCPNDSGSGDINELINLPPGSSLTYQLTATVTATEGNSISNTATVTLPAGLGDNNPANNSATDTDPVGLFADGFEDEFNPKG